MKMLQKREFPVPKTHCLCIWLERYNYTVFCKIILGGSETMTMVTYGRSETVVYFLWMKYNNRLLTEGFEPSVNYVSI